MKRTQRKIESPISITSVEEAAREFGVSERTIYRKLRSGQFQRVKKSMSFVNNYADSSRDHQTQIVSQNVSQMSNNSDILLTSKMAALQEEANRKDAEIARLTAVQHELTQTVQRLQEQIFELARLTLSQPRPTETAVPSSENSPEEKQMPRLARRGGLLARILRKPDNKAN